MSQTIRASDGQVWTLPEFIMSPQEAAERDGLLASRFFLVRQGSLGEIFRCGECKGRHAYLTLRCCERPFSGIAEGLWGYLKVAGTPQAFARMTAEERARVERITRLFGEAADQPDLSSSHPEMARAIGVGERDIFRGTVPLGILEEIPASLAQRYQSRINARGCRPKLALPGLKED
jgi:hypothetical protein